MRAVAQRVIDCSVSVETNTIGIIKRGLLVYIGVENDDSEKDVKYITEKIINLRIFNDSNKRMNLSVKDIEGQLLVISQFTLLGDVRRGRRPSYTRAANPDYARKYYNLALNYFKKSGLNVEAGKFRALMEVKYTNVGPVTILLDSHKLF